MLSWLRRRRPEALPSPDLDSEALKRRGHALLEQGQLASAEESFRRAVELDPCNTGAWLNLGFLLHGHEKFGEAKIAILVNDRKGGLHASAWLRSAVRVEFLEDMDADGRFDIVAKGTPGLAIQWNRIDRPIVRGEHTDLDSDGRIDGCQGAAFTRGNPEALPPVAPHPA